MRVLHSDRSPDVDYRSIPEPKTEAVTQKCKICGKWLAVVIPAEGEMFREEFERLAKMAVHNECLDRHRSEQKAAEIVARERERMKEWETVCPADFRKPILKEKRGYSEHFLGLVMDWKYGEMGLRLEGKSRLCKTRFMFHLLAREWMAGRSIAVFVHGHLRSVLSALAASDSAAFGRFVLEMQKKDILFIDDLGKGRRTPASEEAIFELIDGRGALCKPTMYTSNQPLAEVMTQFSEEFREPIFLRIEEKTTLITFQKTK